MNLFQTIYKDCITDSLNDSQSLTILHKQIIKDMQLFLFNTTLFENDSTEFATHITFKSKSLQTNLFHFFLYKCAKANELFSFKHSN